MTVRVKEGTPWSVVVEDRQGNEVVFELEAADFSRDRIDLIFELDGEIGAARGEIGNGAAALIPIAPDVPFGAKILAHIKVRGESTSLMQYDITEIQEGVQLSGEVPLTGTSMILDSEDPFDRLLIPIVEVNRRKRADYASDQNLFANFDRNAAAMNLPGYGALEDCLSMVTRKLGRITNLRGRDPLNETVRDSYLDLAVYAILALGLAEREAAEEYRRRENMLPQLEAARPQRRVKDQPQA